MKEKFEQQFFRIKVKMVLIEYNYLLIHLNQNKK